MLAIIFSIAVTVVLVSIYTYVRVKHNKKVSQLRKLLQLEKSMYQNYIHATTLDACYIVYKDLIKYFFPYVANCSSLNADPYGIFRASGDPYSPNYQDSLKNITKDEIFLGNINGLWTKPLSYWETYGDVTSKELVLKQFRKYLHDGFVNIENKLNKEIS